MELSRAEPDRIFFRIYSRYETKPDALGLTWTKEELKELGSVYAAKATVPDIEQHLSRYPADPANAVASVLPKVSPEDIIRGGKRPPVISQLKNLFAISNEACQIRACIQVKSDLGFLILQRSWDDTFGGQWEFPGGQINADEDVFKGSVRELEEETGLKGQVRLHSFNKSRKRRNNLLLYQFNSSAKVEGNEPGWERRIRLSKEHQGFAWTKDMGLGEYAPGTEMNIQEGLKNC
ncbi:hypothetical protein BDW67DRAFT_189450 [Aspergillus spinulosporus]